MSRRTIILLAVLTLAVAALAPVTAGAQAQPRQDLSAVSDGPNIAGEAPAPANPKGDQVVVDVPQIQAAANSARSALAGGGLNPTGFLARGLVSIIVTFDDTLTGADVAAAVGGELIYEYRHAMRGAAVALAANELKTLEGITGVTAVYANDFKTIDTEVSPGFIGAGTAWDRVGGQSDAGEGVVVGVIDTGIWPEHPSFSDPDPAGGPYPEPPASFGGTGCDFGDTGYNPDDVPFTCNNKLVAAYDFTATYALVEGLLPTEFSSARDANGHGTHTASTAAGNGGVEASIFGIPRGTISGIAPRAHVAAYKACGFAGCFDSDLVAAIDQAIDDGVDVINYSIGGGQSDPYLDANSIAFLAAYDEGIFVATSAGNSGPGAETVGSPGDAPWITTVGASTTDRHFISTVTLVADNSDTLVLEGASVTHGIGTATPVVLASDFGDGMCNSPFAPGTFSGQIVVCERGVIARVEKSYNAAQGGAGGMLLYNPTLQGLATDNHFIPSVHLENDSGADLLAFMAGHTGVMATFTQGTATTVQGDVMAAFSSRGGQGYLTIKPDVTAPGVQILAGHSPLPESVEGGLPGELFQAIQGTSMSSPHVAGAGALLADIHPDWTPGQIKSALMMTAVTDGVTKEDRTTPSDVFDRGSGRIDLSQAAGAGLTISEDDFLTNQGQEWDNNHPSLWVPNLPGLFSTERTVHNETGQSATWRLSVDAPSDVDISVPRSIRVPRNGDKMFEIEIDARDVPQGEMRFAVLTLKKGSEELRFPIAFTRDWAGISVDKTCDPSAIKVGETTECEITVENLTYQTASVSVRDELPRELRLIGSSIEGGERRGWNTVAWDGELYGATPGYMLEPLGFIGYFSLTNLGAVAVPPPSNPDDGGYAIGGLDIDYAGVTYTSAIWSVNGTLELGTASGITAGGANQGMPNVANPNNLLAPWWTDLNLTSAGAWYLETVTDGVTEWDVFEWKDVPTFSNPMTTYSFQIWLTRGSDEIYFSYGSTTSGTNPVGTTGIESSDGSQGSQYYFNGTGTNPWVTGEDLQARTDAGEPGETHTITFEAVGARKGKWTNWAYATSEIFDGVATDGASGEVKQGRPRPHGNAAD